jgi:hypothetical protein
MRSSLGSNHVNIRVVGLILVDLKSFEECIFFFQHVPRVDLHCVVLKPILSVLATSPTEGVSGCLDENLMGLKIIKRFNFKFKCLNDIFGDGAKFYDLLTLLYTLSFRNCLIES